MPKIIELWAFVAEDEGPEDEGVMAIQMAGTNIFMPMVAADMERVNDLKFYADKISEISGKPYKIKRFKLIED